MFLAFLCPPVAASRLCVYKGPLTNIGLCLKKISWFVECYSRLLDQLIDCAEAAHMCRKRSDQLIFAVQCNSTVNNLLKQIELTLNCCSKILYRYLLQWDQLIQACQQRPSCLIVLLGRYKAVYFYEGSKTSLHELIADYLKYHAVKYYLQNTLKGPCHQIRIAWKWCSFKGLG